jgi:hypothetical protein
MPSEPSVSSASPVRTTFLAVPSWSSCSGVLPVPHRWFNAQPHRLFPIGEPSATAPRRTLRQCRVTVTVRLACLHWLGPWQGQRLGSASWTLLLCVFGFGPNVEPVGTVQFHNFLWDFPFFNQFKSEFDSNSIETCSNLGNCSNHFKPLNSSGFSEIKL